MNTRHLNGKGYFLDFIRDTGDTIGGMIVGAQFAWHVPSVGSLIIGIVLIVLSLILEKWDRNATWRLAAFESPVAGVDVLGYHKDWIDEDFCPDGIRMCTIVMEGDNENEHIWANAMWCPQHDCYSDNDVAPIHWKRIV